MGLPDDATCFECGYALRELTACVCPECGRSFSATDPTTYRVLGGKPSWRRWATAPTPWTIAPAIGLSIYILTDLSAPGILFPWCVLYVVGIVFGVYACADYLRRRAACERDSDRAARDITPTQLHRRSRWVVLPVCLCLVFSAWATDWPIRLRFAASRSAFEAMHQQIEISGVVPSGEQWIGLYRVKIRREGQYVYYVTGQVSLRGEGGFGKGTGVEGELSVAVRIVGDWYVVNERLD